jgi:hypothetical protein
VLGRTDYSQTVIHHKVTGPRPHWPGPPNRESIARPQAGGQGPGTGRGAGWNRVGRGLEGEISTGGDVVARAKSGGSRGGEEGRVLATESPARAAGVGPSYGIAAGLSCSTKILRRVRPRRKVKWPWVAAVKHIN